MGLWPHISKKLGGKKPPPPATEQQVLAALKNVIDPDLGQDIVSLGFVHKVKIDGGRVHLTVNLTTPACPAKDMLRDACIKHVSELPPVETVEVELTATQRRTAPSTGTARKDGLAAVRRIVAVASGKGGVGKSTTTVLLAHALKKAGASVGVLDADIYGPSLPTMTGAAHPTEMDGNLVVPPVKDGIAMISPAMFSSENKAQVLRGPMAANMVKQLLGQVRWGSLDYLLIDLPPGTGDIQLTIAQSCTLSGAVVVTTPQDVALADVRKAVDMLSTLRTAVIGVVENMSFFACDGCGKSHRIFGQGGGKRLASEFGLPLLGAIPLDPTLTAACDRGQALSAAASETESGRAYQEVGANLVRELAIMEQQQESGLGSFRLTWRH